jgi:hypothetical protein
MKHTSETSETLETYYCSMPQKTIGTYATCATSVIYFCNIHMIQLHYTSEMSETIEIYNYNIGGEREPNTRSAMVAGSMGSGGSRCRSRAMRQRRRHRRGRARPRTGVEAGGGQPEKRKGSPGVTAWIRACARVGDTAAPE